MEQAQIGILGSGKIACDLLKKVLRSKHLFCKMFAGRSTNSEGIAYANNLGVCVSTHSIDAILEEIDYYDLIFDATSALSHMEHKRLLAKHSKPIINLTPAGTGMKCIPAVNIGDIKFGNTIDMITCGAQVAIPIIHSIKECVHAIRYIEVVSSISSESAGLATRLNIDEYLNYTEEAIFEFSKCSNTKAILNINPAIPCVDMQTTVYMLLEEPFLKNIIQSISLMIQRVQSYAPYYEIISTPILEGEKLTVIIKVRGMADYLPSYAGNLDIITSASVKVAEYIYKHIDNKHAIKSM